MVGESDASGNEDYVNNNDDDYSYVNDTGLV